MWKGILIADGVLELFWNNENILQMHNENIV